MQEKRKLLPLDQSKLLLQMKDFKYLFQCNRQADCSNNGLAVKKALALETKNKVLRHLEGAETRRFKCLH